MIGRRAFLQTLAALAAAATVPDVAKVLNVPTVEGLDLASGIDWSVWRTVAIIDGKEKLEFFLDGLDVSDDAAIVREMARLWFKTTRDGRDYLGIGEPGSGWMFPIEDSREATYLRFNVRVLKWPDEQSGGRRLYDDLESHTTGLRSRFIQRRLGAVT